ncbi:hypothetical protein BGAL_0228g00070 [Botrytis galanthina]|uniref:Cytochrome P450 n=1 Tax=Botrytis galanthina TaxID=278940 RepID=A0A4S8QU09_9HELO|nr:hypothetical protein BGAL_0228g00070 [Botrytis galanthina]
MLLYLVQNPEKLHKLVAEIRKTFQREEDIKIATLRDLPYLNAVINEGLRLKNPVPGGLPRIVPPGGDIYVDTLLPPGVSIHHLTRYSNITDRCRQPFSIGHSNCIEIWLVIARLLWAFDVAETEKRLDWTKLKTLMIIQKESIMLSIKIREGINELSKTT